MATATFKRLLHKIRSNKVNRHSPIWNSKVAATFDVVNIQGSQNNDKPGKIRHGYSQEKLVVNITINNNRGQQQHILRSTGMNQSAPIKRSVTAWRYVNNNHALHPLSIPLFAVNKKSTEKISFSVQKSSQFTEACYSVKCLLVFTHLTDFRVNYYSSRVLKFAQALSTLHLFNRKSVKNSNKLSA